MRTHRVRVLLMGEQACVFYGAAEFSRDTDFAILANSANLARLRNALAELQAALYLPGPPNRIECYDISNLQGTAAAGSMVVFEQGAPKKAHYRSFNIKSVEGPNDFASMKEALTRRFRRWKEQQGMALSSPSSLNSQRRPGQKKDESFSHLPDLLIIDGGKGQLGVAVEVLTAFELSDRVPVCGLAKQQEEIFLPGKSESILLPRRSQGLYLVQRVRDEAHRFALTHHRSRRGKIGLASQLDAIPGIGPARRKGLLKRFGSLDGIREATLEQLLNVRGMTREAAEAVKAHL